MEKTASQLTGFFNMIETLAFNGTNKWLLSKVRNERFVVDNRL